MGKSKKRKIKKKAPKKSFYTKAAENSANAIAAIKANPYQVVPLVLSFLALIIIILQNTSFRIGDGDVAWHIMAGYNIRENGVNSHEPYSFTTIDYPWYNISWLWDIFVSLLDSIGGLNSMVILTAIMAGMAAAYLTYHSLARGAGLLAIAVVFIIVMPTFQPAMTARPHLLTYLLILLFIDVLRKYVDGAYSRKALMLLLLPFLVWVNSHGHFVVGLTIIGAFGIEMLARRKWVQLRELFIFGCACLVLTLVNPFGYHIFEGMYRTTNGIFRDHIVEWRPLFRRGHFIFMIFSAAMVLLTIRKQRISDIVLMAIWCFKAYFAVRFLIIYNLVAFAPAALGLSVILFHFRQVAKADIWVQKFLRKKYLTYGAYGVAGIAAVALCTSNLYYEYKKPIYVPVSEIKFVTFAHPEARVLNLYDYGGYLQYYSKGKVKTFFDGRADTAFPPQLVKDYIKVKDMRPGWRMIFDKYDIDVFLYAAGSRQVREMTRSGEWRNDYSNGKAAVLVRTRPRQPRAEENYW